MQTIKKDGPVATVVDVMRFFGMQTATFKKQWGELTDKDKADLKQGIGDGSLTY
jgi:hypothetical protein